MQRFPLIAIALSFAGAAPALAQTPMPLAPNGYSRDQAMIAAQPQGRVRQSDLGGGFIEFLFGDRGYQQPLPPAPNLPYGRRDGYAPPVYANAPAAQYDRGSPRDNPDPRFQRQEVNYDGKEEPGTIIINTPQRLLYLVEPGGRAVRYGIGVGRPGFTWAGTHSVSAKKEWPDWRPPAEMLARQPYLPTFMAGGPDNPLGARAMYLGSTLYRIHGSNEPWTIGHQVSSGCIRMRNEDVIDLYERVKVGTKVVVI